MAHVAVGTGERRWDRVADARMGTLDNLMDYRPAGLGELEVLKGFVPEDQELVSLDVILDDIRALIGEGGR